MKGGVIHHGIGDGDCVCTLQCFAIFIPDNIRQRLSSDYTSYISTSIVTFSHSSGK